MIWLSKNPYPHRSMTRKLVSRKKTGFGLPRSAAGIGLLAIELEAARVDQRRAPVDAMPAARQALEFALGDQARDDLPAPGDAHGAGAFRFVHDRGQIMPRLGDRIFLLYHGVYRMVI